MTLSQAAEAVIMASSTCSSAPDREQMSITFGSPALRALFMLPSTPDGLHTRITESAALHALHQHP